MLSLKTYCGPETFANRFTAGGPSTVSRTDDHFVSQRQELSEEAVEELAGIFRCLFPAHQIDSSHLSGKESIPAKDHGRETGRVPEEIAHAPGCMAGRGDGLKLQTARLPFLARLHRTAIPVVPLAVCMPDLGSSPVCQLHRAHKIVLIAMGLQDVSNPHSGLCCRFHIDLNVSAGIDYQGLVLISGQIGVMSQTLRDNSFEDHSSIQKIFSEAALQ